ncbi:MAG: response regulator transcription factor [Chloroflexi bacterium]|nr:response regulator transcription factor [Chloroflexota bacterium]MBP8058499.1 response regulator transcription factor [Chloroflexota bacterium]
MPAILMVEDHVPLAQILTRFLREKGNMEVRAVAQTGKEALAQLSQLVVDIVLVDVSLPVMSGIDLVAILHKEYPDLPCMMLSGHRRHSYVQRSLDVGARGYVTKDNTLNILEGVKAVLKGEIYLSPDVRELQD